MLSSAERPVALLAAPNSPRNRSLLLARAHSVIALRRSTPMVADTAVALVPDESLSRYWCTSKAKLLSGSTVPRPITVSLSPETQEWAPVQLVPGTRIFSVAPASRMALTAALTEGSQAEALKPCGSFMMLYMTPEPLKASAIWPQNLAKAEEGTWAEPMSYLVPLMSRAP